MYKIIILDDEPLIRSSIHSLIDEHFSDCLVTECDNTTEGKKIIKDLSPDLIITDIRMDQSSGLDMLQDIQTSAKIIVITGYRKIEYAMQAISLNVFSFILKPIQWDELRDTISKALKSVDTQKNDREKISSIQAEFESYTNEKYLSEMLYGFKDLSLDESNDIHSPHSINLKNFFVAGIQLDGSSEINSRCIGDARNTFTDFFQSNLKYKNKCYILCPGNNRIDLIIRNDYNHYNSRLLAEDFCELKYEVVQNHPEITVSIGLSREGTSFSQLNEKYSESQKAVVLARFLDGSLVVSCDDIMPIDDSCDMSKLYTLKEFFEASLSERNADMVQSSLSQINKILETIYNSKSAKYIKQFYKNQLLNINKIRNALLDINPVDECNHILEQNINVMVDTCDANATLNDTLLLSVKNILDISKIDSQNISKHIKKAIHFINENYCENITLADVAAHIYLSSVHTSRLFKKETGKNVIDYINEKRIDEAKRLMDKTEHKIYEISQMVGFQNTHYFSTVFKKLTQMSPREYAYRQKNDVQN